MKLAAFALIGALGIVATAAVAQTALTQIAPTQIAPGQAPPAFSSLLALIEAQGYRIIEAEATGRWFEVEAITADGRRVELYADANTGQIVQEEPYD